MSLYVAIMAGLAIAAAAIAVVVSAEEHINERIYGNGKETGIGREQGQPVRGDGLTDEEIAEWQSKGRLW